VEKWPLQANKDSVVTDSATNRRRLKRGGEAKRYAKHSDKANFPHGHPLIDDADVVLLLPMERDSQI
jgi:hypothetical protein